MAKVFDKGYEMTSPHNCGKFFNEVTIEELRKIPLTLTEEERKSSCAKYYDLPEVGLPQECWEAMQKPMNTEDCYMPDKVAEHMLNAESDTVENGFGVTENGIGYAAIRVNQVGRTDEKVKWYREHFAREGNLFYKAWYPGAHLVHMKNGAVEDFGWGMLTVQFTIDDFDMSLVGIDTEKIEELDPNCISVFGAGAICHPLAHPEEEEYVSMFCYTRKTDWGRELRVRYWESVLFQADGTFKVQKNITGEEMLRKAKLHMEHCMKEYYNEQRLMNLFWDERGKN